MQTIFSVNEGTNNCFNTVSSTEKPYDPDTPTFTLKNAKRPKEIWYNTDYLSPMNRTERTKLLENKKSDSKTPPRPLNSYFIYNNYARGKQKYKKMVAKKRPKSEINELIGEDWKKEPEEVKDIFKCGAEVAKKEHAKKHKDYKYKKRNQKKGNKKKYVEKNRSTASFSMLTTSLPSSKQCNNNNNSQILIPTMEESDVSIPDTTPMEESYQSDASILFDPDIPEQLSNSVNASQELADLPQFENIESNSSIIEELHQSSDSFFSPTTFTPISTESRFTTSVDTFSQHHPYTSLEFMGNQPSNYPSTQAVSNILGFGTPGYSTCGQDASILSNMGYYHNIQSESNIGPAYDFSLYPDSLIESSVSPTITLLNDPYGSIGFNNSPGLAIEDPQWNKLTCNQIAELTYNQIAELTCNQIVELTCNQIAKLTCNQIAELTCNQIVELTCNQIAKLTCNQIAKLTCNQIAELTCSNGEIYKEREV
ncbi:unnamed protein product [Rhizophagus irregularis]|nr:unnamed protein product [Rhizophagus irregularis]CAB4435052.1 unnamed protein product [Rhizophagus irregularis]